MKGQILLEVLVGVGVFAVVITTLLGVLVVSLRGGRFAQETTVGKALAEEYKNVLSSLSRSNWNSIYATVNQPTDHFRIRASGTVWVIEQGEEVVTFQGVTFTRYFTGEKVYRDLNGDIVTTGGTEDSSTVKSTISVRSEDFNLQEMLLLTRWGAAAAHQATWGRGPGVEGPVTQFFDGFSTSGNIAFATTSFKLLQTATTSYCQP